MKTELDKKYEEFKEKEFHHYLWAFAKGEGEFERIYPDNLEFLEYLNDPEFKDYLKYNKFLTPSLETAKEIWDFLNKECWILLLSEELYWPKGLIDLKSEVGRTYLVGGYTLKNEEDYGGEGEGDQYWFILSVEKDGIKKFYKLWGYYASYDGGYIDQIEEVVPKEVMRTEWVKSPEEFVVYIGELGDIVRPFSLNYCSFSTARFHHWGEVSSKSGRWMLVVEPSMAISISFDPYDNSFKPEMIFKGQIPNREFFVELMKNLKYPINCDE